MSIISKKDYIIFDLDGTLVDSGDGVLNSVVYALNKFGITVNSKNELFGFMGPPLDDSFIKYFGFSKPDALQAVKYYRERYSDIGLMEYTVYPGIKDLLVNLKAAGKKLLVGTSKPVVFAKKVLESAGLDIYFDGIFGSEFDGTRAYKTDVLLYALEQSGITDKSKVIMVGDRKYDVIGAHDVGIECIGVLFGYGSKDEFIGCGADYICEAASDVLHLLNGEKRVLVINGPNLNMLGIREPNIYGNQTYNHLVCFITDYCKRKNIQVSVFQSNHEGDIVDKIQQAYLLYEGIVINPAAYTHTSVAIADALKAVSIPFVEVHLSDVDSRETFRKLSYISGFAIKRIAGLGFEGYLRALDCIDSL